MNTTVYLAVHRDDGDEPLMLTRNTEDGRCVWTNARTEASQFTSIANALAAVVEFETQRGRIATSWYKPGHVSIEPDTGAQS